MPTPSQTLTASARPEAAQPLTKLRNAYTQALADAESIIKPLVGMEVGAVRVSVPQEYHDASYECAAWWQTRLGATGVYCIVVSRDPYEKNRLFLSAKLPATIKADYFQSLYCGTSIGQPYDTTSNAGKPCVDVTIVRPIKEAIRATSASDDDSDGTKWAILPKYWQTLAEYHRALAKAYMAYFALAQYLFATEADDRFSSKLGQVGHAGERVHFHVECAVEIERAIKFRTDGSTDYFTRNNPFAVQPEASR